MPLFRQEILLSLNYVKSNVLSLAKAMPAEKYGWRPGEGVRSVGEVYVHIANGNRLLLSLVRTSPPSPQEFRKMIADNEQKEKTLTDKEGILADLAKSFDEVDQAIQQASAKDMERKLKAFGQDTSLRGIFISITGHASEHLGQSIAYARINGIVPPWSAPQKKE